MKLIELLKKYILKKERKKKQSINWNTESGIPTIYTRDKTLRQQYREE